VFFFFFSRIIHFFPIFAPAKSREIDLVRESAFFALFLRGESGQFTSIMEDDKWGGGFPCYVRVFKYLT